MAVRRTLRGRVSLLALAVIAAWLAVLTIAFNGYLAHRLHAQSDSTLRVRAQAASATVALGDGGRVVVRESSSDSDLDSDIWIFAGTRAVERPAAPGEPLQRFADSLAGASEQYADLEDDARIYVLPVRIGGRSVATVVAALSTAGEHRAERIALIGSVLVSGLLLAVAYPVMRLAVRRALDPVDQMARQASEWSAHETSRRFGGGQHYEELRALGGDLDGLLDRLSAVLRRERLLTGELSHELRTPLTRIAAEADLLVRSGASSDLDAHRSIADAARAMDRIIETILDASRAESSMLAGTCRLDDALDAFGDAALVRTGTAGVTVGVDVMLLERILAPLLDNAHRYARSSVQVAAAPVAAGVQIDVIDDGAALRAEHAEQVFQPGFRAAPQDGHAGAGLGLALARRLARATDGELTAIAGDGRTTLRLVVPSG